MANVAMPRTESGGHDVEAAKRIYMDSSIVEWGPFCASVGWSPISTRNHYPTYQWLREKRDILSKIANEKIAEQWFHRAHSWQEDVLKSLERYPAAIDGLFALAQAKLNPLLAKLQRDMQSPNSPIKEMDGVEIRDIERIANLVEKLTTSKYKSLLLDQTLVKIKESVDKNLQSSAPEHKDTKTSDIVYEIMGSEKLTGKQLQEMLMRYMDPPQMKEAEVVIAPENSPVAE